MWAALAEHDEAAITYLTGRKLWPLSAGIVRFTTHPTHRVAVALRDVSGRIVGIERRAIAEVEPKLLCMAGSAKSSSLFGRLDGERPVLLVEGLADYLAAEILADSLGVCPVAVAGAGCAPRVPERFAPALRGRRVYVCLDNDEKGRSQVAPTCAALQKVGAEPVAVTYPAGFKDMAELVEKRGPDAAGEIMVEVLDGATATRLLQLATLAPESSPPQKAEELRSDDRPEGAQADSADRLVVTMEEFLAEYFPPAPSLWGDALLVRGGGYLIMGGDTGVGKTILLANLIFALAAGWNRFLGFALAGRPVPVLFLEAEGSRHLFRERLRQIAQNLGVSTASLPLFFHRADVQLSIAGDSLRRMVEESRAELVFLDPVGRFHGGNENYSTDWRQHVVHPLAALSREFSLSVAFADHYSKPNENRTGQHKIRGSGAKLQDCGAAMRLEIGRAGGRSRVLFFDRVRDGALPFPEKDPCRMALEIDLAAGRIAQDEREDADGLGSYREGQIADVVEVVRKLGPIVNTGVLLAGIEQKLGLEKSRANDLIAAALANKAIERPKRGCYQIPGNLLEASA